ncbi:hypothetical protein [Streptomyces sp. NPDC059460]|uniref:hypothetical protein n=1 Tax=Streptomyces sp. NPDC059460 TaxID=3346840 RepID=UPI00367B1367
MRSRLVRAGFGPLQSGLWVAPGRVDVAPLTAELGLGDRIRAFHGEAAAPTEAGPLLRTAFDVDAIAEGYRASWPGGATASRPLRCATARGAGSCSTPTGST